MSSGMGFWSWKWILTSAVDSVGTSCFGTSKQYLLWILFLSVNILTVDPWLFLAYFQCLRIHRLYEEVPWHLPDVFNTILQYIFFVTTFSYWFLCDFGLDCVKVLILFVVDLLLLGFFCMFFANVCGFL